MLQDEQRRDGAVCTKLKFKQEMVAVNLIAFYNFSLFSFDIKTAFEHSIFQCYIHDCFCIDNHFSFCESCTQQSKHNYASFGVAHPISGLA